MLKIENNVCAQGDMLIRRINELPKNAVLQKPESGRFVLAHSETGHSHVVKQQPGVQFYQAANDNNIAYLVVDNTKCFVEHERSFHTHAPLEFDSGVYEIRRQIESDDTPQGWRRAID